MKTNHLVYTILVSLFLIVCSATNHYAEPTIQKKTRTRIKVYNEKLSNDNRKISIILIQGSGKRMAGVQNAEVLLTTYNLDEEIELTSLYTDVNGEAFLFIEANYVFPKDENGFSVIKATYNGNDSLRAANKQIKFLNMHLEIAFNVIDSVKNLAVSTFEFDSAGNKQVIEGIKLNIGVERLYSILYIEEIETDEDGQGIMEFPNDIPGDSIGKLIVMAKVNEDDDYGTITKSAEINWGRTVDYTHVNNVRSLFGDQAPLWMIISVAIILAGAWYHFILATIKVFKIKKLAQDSIQ